MTILSVLPYIAYAFASYYAIKAFWEWNTRRREVNRLKKAIYAMHHDIAQMMMAAAQQPPPLPTYAPAPAPPPGYITTRLLLSEREVANILAHACLRRRDVTLAAGQTIISQMLLIPSPDGFQFRIEASFDPHQLA